MQLTLKVLWDGHLARPDWAGKMPTPQFIMGFNNGLQQWVATEGCNRKAADSIEPAALYCTICFLQQFTQGFVRIS